MNHTLSVREFAPDEWRTYRDLRLRSLSDSPDAFGSKLEFEQNHSDAHWSQRLISGTQSPLELPLMAQLSAEPIGLAWGRVDPSDPETAFVYQMWVDSESRRLGAAHLLLTTVIEWARVVGARFVILGVTLGNVAASRLYAEAGFTPLGEPEPLRPGSVLLSQTLRLKLENRAT